MQGLDKELLISSPTHSGVCGSVWEFNSTVFLTTSTAWTKQYILAGLSEDSWSLPLLTSSPLLPRLPPSTSWRDVSQTSKACQWGMNAMNSLERQRDKILRHWGHSLHSGSDGDLLLPGKAGAQVTHLSLCHPFQLDKYRVAKYKTYISQTRNASHWGMNAMNSLGNQRDKMSKFCATWDIPGIF